MVTRPPLLRAWPSHLSVVSGLVQSVAAFCPLTRPGQAKPKPFVCRSSLLFAACFCRSSVTIVDEQSSIFPIESDFCTSRCWISISVQQEVQIVPVQQTRPPAWQTAFSRHLLEEDWEGERTEKKAPICLRLCACPAPSLLDALSSHHLAVCSALSHTLWHNPHNPKRGSYVASSRPPKTSLLVGYLYQDMSPSLPFESFLLLFPLAHPSMPRPGVRSFRQGLLGRHVPP